MKGQQLGIFISYVRENADQAKRLFESLSSLEGVAPWMDSESLLPGQVWKDEISQAIRECRFIIVLLSRAALNREGYFHKEVKLAIEKWEEQPEGRITLIPARLESCVPRNDIFTKLHWVDMFPDWDQGMCKLLAPICAALGGELCRGSAASTRAVMRSAKPVDRFRPTQGLTGQRAAASKRLAAPRISLVAALPPDLTENYLYIGEVTAFSAIFSSEARYSRWAAITGRSLGRICGDDLKWSPSPRGYKGPADEFIAGSLRDEITAMARDRDADLVHLRFYRRSPFNYAIFPTAGLAPTNLRGKVSARLYRRR